MNVKPVHELLAEAFPLLGNVKQGYVDARLALLSLKESVPDAADAIDVQVAKLDEQIAAFDVIVEQADLVHMGATALAELKNILKIGLSGKSHPHSTTGG